MYSKNRNFECRNFSSLRSEEEYSAKLWEVVDINYGHRLIMPNKLKPCLNARLDEPFGQGMGRERISCINYLELDVICANNF
jgi:hypothetical protein